MCALNLIKRYQNLHIQAFCDWYGPDYPITIDSTGYGSQVTVNPKSAMYLYAGTCENNRVAYNETAAEALKVSYSHYTSLLQQHDWTKTPKVITVSEAITLYNSPKLQQNTIPMNTIILIATGFSITLVAVVFAAWKLRKK